MAIRARRHGRWPRRAMAALVTALIATAAGCGGKDTGDDRRASATITVWSLEHQPDRARATNANLAEFTRRTGIRVELVLIGDDELPTRMSRARADGALPDVAQLPLDFLHKYARDGLLDPDAAEAALERLGDETFSQTALTLASDGGRVLGVPTDGWGQLLIYRKDLFRQAGLAAPRTLEDLRRAARRLQAPGRAGITLPSDPSENFTAEIFEHFGLAAGCELVDDRGAVTLGTRRCREAFRLYRELARDGGPVTAPVTRDAARDAYFAGRTAMIFWSPFLLDAMAGLGDDARPTCRQCRRDPAFLARNSGLVGPLSSDDGPPAQYGSIASWGIFEGADAAASSRFVQYMLSDGYLRWLALSPQGKFPVRPGDAADPERYMTGWARLRSGVTRKAPLREFYPADAIASLGDGVRVFRRWGFAQDQAALAGAVRESQAVSRAVAETVSGQSTPQAAARRAAAAVERLKPDTP